MSQELEEFWFVNKLCQVTTWIQKYTWCLAYFLLFWPPRQGNSRLLIQKFYRLFRLILIWCRCKAPYLLFWTQSKTKCCLMFQITFFRLIMIRCWWVTLYFDFGTWAETVGSLMIKIALFRLIVIWSWNNTLYFLFWSQSKTECSLMVEIAFFRRIWARSWKGFILRLEFESSKMQKEMENLPGVWLGFSSFGLPDREIPGVWSRSFIDFSGSYWFGAGAVISIFCCVFIPKLKPTASFDTWLFSGEYVPGAINNNQWRNESKIN